MTSRQYYIKARLFPTILTIIPLLVFVNVIVLDLYYGKLTPIFDILPVLINLGLSTALIFLMVQINRLIAKEVFQRFYFQDELEMPTTNHLLWSDTLIEESVKEKLHAKIFSMFGIQIQNAEEERNDELKSRKQIATAVSQIRITLEDNKLLLQHNIEYGFFRNLIGGSLIALLFSIVILIYGSIKYMQNLQTIGIIFLFIYLIPLALSKLIIKRYGEYYSKILFEQFLSI